MSMKLFIGIDPGLKGGIAFVREDGHHAWAYKMPETDADILSVFADIQSGDYEPFALLEQVHAMPGQGVSSCFTFGEGYGKLQMALAALQIPYERTSPVKWQKALGCLSKGNKNVTKAKAQELFPNVKITHNIADALLIAEYCKRSRS